MNTHQAKTIPVQDYLSTVEGITPNSSRQWGRELWYRSPLRSGDSTPSFKIDTMKNLWHDHGLAVGWTIIDLVCAIRNVSVRQALAILDQSGLYAGWVSVLRSPTVASGWTQPLFSVPAKKIVAGEKEKCSVGGSVSVAKHEILSVGALSSPSLLHYLSSRCIDPVVASEYLLEVRFKPVDKLVEYFALGWKNGAGYEVRNKYFKGFVGLGKTVSLLPSTCWSADVLVFEGFMDFLSYLTLCKRASASFVLKPSVLVLNSVSLRRKGFEVLLSGDSSGGLSVSRVHCYFDHDEAGMAALDYFREACSEIGLDVVDHSSLYQSFHDVNAYLVDVVSQWSWLRTD